MEIFQMARDLANALLESEQGIKMQETQFIFDGNEEARQKLLDYNTYRETISYKAQSGELNEEEIKAESGKLSIMIEDLKKNHIINDMIIAEGNFNNLVNQVMGIFEGTLKGESTESGGCSGGCGGCSGCH